MLLILLALLQSIWCNKCPIILVRRIVALIMYRYLLGLSLKVPIIILCLEGVKIVFDNMSRTVIVFDLSQFLLENTNVILCLERRHYPVLF